MCDTVGIRLEDVPTHSGLLSHHVPLEALKKLRDSHAWLPQAAAAEAEGPPGLETVPTLSLVAVLCRHVAEEAVSKTFAGDGGSNLVRHCSACIGLLAV